MIQKLCFFLIFFFFSASHHRQKEQLTFILQIQKTENINGQMLDKESNSLVYIMHIFTQKNNETPIQMKENYYLFEDKQDQENPPYKFGYADGSEEDALNAIKAGEIYHLTWQKMPSKTWSDTTNSIHIEKSQKHPHTNYTFIHQADGIRHLAGCKSICLQKDLKIDASGNVKVKNGYLASQKTMKEIRKLYDAVGATRFELWYKAIE